MPHCEVRPDRRTIVLCDIGCSLPLRIVRVLVIIALIFCGSIWGQNKLAQTCGKRQVNTLFLVHRGVAAEPGHWPWHAAIFLSKSYVRYEYACGGSIIAKNTILTAAHCLFVYDRMVHSNHILVRVGQVDLNETTTDNQQELAVSKLLPHPKFNIRNGVAHDIAIIKLSTEIEMNRFVQPICLWDMNDDPAQLVGKNGSIVGFGLNEHDQLPGILQETTLTVVDLIDCLESDRVAYGGVLTRQMYCAGRKEGVSACNGDSGGGMFFEIADRWYVRGIVSFIAKRQTAVLCDSSMYTVFTDVSKYRAWVMQSMLDSPPPRRLPHLEPCSEGRVPPLRNMCNIASEVRHSFLLVGQDNYIIRVPLNGGQSFKIATTYGTNRLDADCANGRVYWSELEEGQIRSANFDGTDQQIFIAKDVKQPRGVAVDWISRRLYWADSLKETIEVARLTNPNARTVLFFGLDDTYAIAVDPLHSKLYWSSTVNGKPSIEWSDLDGRDRRVLVSYPQVKTVTKMQVSLATGELCYVDATAKKIECIDPHTKHIRTIVSNLTAPHRLAVTDELFYWTEWEKRSIESMDSNGVRQKPIIATDFNFFNSEGMTVVTDRCPFFYSPCALDNGGCPENTICLTNKSFGPRCILKRKCKAGFECTELLLDN